MKSGNQVLTENDSDLVHHLGPFLDINTISGSVHLGAEESTCSVKAPNGADRKEGDAPTVPRFPLTFGRSFRCFFPMFIRLQHSSAVRNVRPGRQGTAFPRN